MFRHSQSFRRVTIPGTVQRSFFTNSISRRGHSKYDKNEPKPDYTAGYPAGTSL